MKYSLWSLADQRVKLNKIRGIVSMLKYHGVAIKANKKTIAAAKYSNGKN
jgi:hypothetical protein